MKSVHLGLPNHSHHADFLYAIEFADGAVKVGVTFSPRRRAAEVRRRYGKAISRVAAKRCAGSGQLRYRAEERALQTLRRIGVASKFSGEMFHGIKFGEAVNAIAQAAKAA